MNGSVQNTIGMGCHAPLHEKNHKQLLPIVPRLVQSKDSPSGGVNASPFLSPMKIQCLKTSITSPFLLMAVILLSSNVNEAAGFMPSKISNQISYSFQYTLPERIESYTRPSTITLFPRGIMTHSTKLPSLLTASTEQENESIDESSFPPTTPTEMIKKFNSYATNIGRTRNIIKGIKVKRNSNSDQSENESQLKMAAKPSPASMSAIRSLVYTLKSESEALLADLDSANDKVIISNDTAVQIQNNMNHALIQAIRAASDHGDYVMIRKIVEAAIGYAKAGSKVYSIHAKHSSIEGVDANGSSLALLQSRVFGEAISGMSRTKASHSKLKKLWSLFIGLRSTCDEDVSSEAVTLMSEPSAFELNAMLTGLGNRGKFRASIKLYEEMTTKNEVESAKIESDQYTASALFTMLANSIALDVSPNSSNTRGLSQSPCWQWNEAMSILDNFENTMELNNQVYSAVLKVNEQAMELYRSPGNRHPGAKCAMSILERMQKRNISPDVVTCSVVMSAFDKGKQWKAALALLKAMESADTELDGQIKTDSLEWLLPKPNVYTYTSAISSCARSGQYEEAIKLLDQVRGMSPNINIGDQEATWDNTEHYNVSENIAPNTWLYNAALAACVPLPNDNDKNGRFETAISIFQRMEEDAEKGFDTSPDRVSYNTLISSIGGIDIDGDIASTSSDIFRFDNVEESTECKHEQIVLNVFEAMKGEGISRDPGTYRNAITACKSNPASTIRLLDKALADPDLLQVSKAEWDSPDIVRLYLMNEVLSVCAAKGNMELVSEIFTYMKDYNLKADSKTMLSLIKGISQSSNCEDSMIALNALKGDGAANEQLKDKYGIDVIQSGIDSTAPMIEEQHYAAAITGCLRDGQLFPALKILNAMKLHGLKPNAKSLQGIILAYCKLATDEATIEFKQSRREYSKGKITGPAFRAEHSSSRTRASAALAMMQTMNNTPIKLQCVVASACAASGMWYEARDILWSIHIAAFQEKKRETSVEAINIDQGSAIEELPKLHRSLLKLCARSGNVTAALWYVDAIQDLRSKFERGSYSTPLPQDYKVLSDEIDVFSTWNSNNTSTALPKYGIGMTGEDWKLLMIAASKSAHWRVCLGTLPFIQPYVEATHPQLVSPEKGKAPSMKSLNKRYESLSRALTASVLAFETRSQYAWAIRVIDDWIEWSGRRPAKEAIFSACRILAARGVGNEVIQLVTKVIGIPNHSKRSKRKVHTYASSYEMAVFTEAITALYKRGLYDSADELYVNAISGGFLPFSTIEQTSESQFKIDLHGMNRVIAHSAVRVSLQHLIQSKPTRGLDRDILIVTGKGKRSSRHLRPVLRPEVQRMLVEEFYPPIGTSSTPNNLGALRISADDANAWIEHQQQQKGVRFLAVADALRTITTGARLKKVLSQRLEKDPPNSKSE